MRDAFINTLTGYCEKRDDILIISGDAGLGVFDKFKENYPGKFLNLGIAEQNAISFSAGLSLTGYKVYYYNIIPFVLYRCYEQVRNDVCYQKLPVVLVGIGSGVTYAPQGITHYAVEDLGLAQTLPNLVVFSPSDQVEVKFATKYSIDAVNPVYIRMAKKGEPQIHKHESLDITLAQEIEDGEDVAIIFHGSVGSEVITARAILEKENIFPKLISLPMLQPLNSKRLFAMLEDIDYVVSVEEHFISTGLGGILMREYAKLHPKWELFSLGIPDKFIHEIKDLQGMRHHFGISAEKIAEFIAGILRGK